VTRNAQCQRDLGVDNGIDRCANVRGEDLGAGQFLVAPVSGEPNFAQRAFLGENDLGVKHGALDNNSGVCPLPIEGFVRLLLLD
jgi:hypothetical protein